MDKNDFIFKCMDAEKAEETGERHWCKIYDEGFDFIDEYCEECTEYQKFVDKMLPKIREILEL